MMPKFYFLLSNILIKIYLLLPFTYDFLSPISNKLCWKAYGMHYTEDQINAEYDRGGK
jgi:hypothetical protein